MTRALQTISDFDPVGLGIPPASARSPPSPRGFYPETRPLSRRAAEAAIPGRIRPKRQLLPFAATLVNRAVEPLFPIRKARIRA